MSGQVYEPVLPRSGSQHRAAYDEVIAAVPDVHPAYLLRLLNELRYDISLVIADLETSDYPLATGGRKVDSSAASAEQLHEVPHHVDCQCCSDACAIANAARCDVGHAFCKDCMNNFVKNAIASQQTDLRCFAVGTDCKALFAPVELKRCVPTSMLDKLEELRIDKGVGSLEGLVRCPFCPMAALLDESEVVFPCPQCKKTSCRRCRKKSHGSNPWHEVPETREDALNAVAEAMSAAVIRKCPSCNVPCLKVDGCNKMTCGPCGARFCYVCNERTEQPGHWNSGGASDGRCPANDDSEKRAAEEAQDARKRKIAELEEMGVSVPSIAKTPKFGPSTPHRTAAQQAALYRMAVTSSASRTQRSTLLRRRKRRKHRKHLEPKRIRPLQALLRAVSAHQQGAPASPPRRNLTDFGTLGWHAHEPEYGYAAAGSGVFGGGGFGGARTGTGSWHGGKGTRADEVSEDDDAPPPAEPEEVMRQRRLYAALARQGRS